MARGWVRDMNYEILELDSARKKQHWDPNWPPITPPIHPQYRRCMSFNIAVNMFGPDADSSGDKSSTSFGVYYETPISEILRKFAHRFENTIPITYDDIYESEKLLEETIMEGARCIYAAALAAEPHPELLMKHLYVKELFVPNHRTLQAVLRRLSQFVKICPWSCVPFLNYSWNDKDSAEYPRPDNCAYMAHLKGHSDPKLPGGTTTLGGSIMNIEHLDYEAFTYYDTSGDDEKCKEYRRTRCFAATWSFIDPLDIIDRNAARMGQTGGKPTPVDDCEEHGCGEVQGPITITSSGNGYKCINGTCQPSNASSFCVSTSCQ